MESLLGLKFSGLTVFGPPPLHYAILARLEAAPARGFARSLGPPWAHRAVKTINSSRWRGLGRNSEHRLELMEGVIFFFKNRFARCARDSNYRLEPIRRP
jgi:hypothetical protein